MTLIYHKEASWEKDYICKEVFQGMETIESTTEQLLNSDFFLKKEESDIVLAFSSNYITYEEILKVVKHLKPKIIVHLSDEYGTRSVYQNLSKYTCLLLRQHYHPSYLNFSNIRLIPLGYGAGMLNGRHSNTIKIKPISERRLNWSFVGNTYKEDRGYMLESMCRIPNNFFSDNIDVEKMKSIYLDSIFVPCGRGGEKLDCFRLYEASICGAIPIVVGINREIEETFVYDKKPPWLFARNWEEGYEKCVLLLSQKDKLIKRQKEILLWWRDTNNSIHTEISKYL